MRLDVGVLDARVAEDLLHDFALDALCEQQYGGGLANVRESGNKEAAPAIPDSATFTGIAPYACER